MRYQERFPMASKYLGRLKKAETRVERMKERLTNLRMLSTDTSVHLTGSSHGGSSESSRMEGLMAEIDALEREIAEEEERVQEIRMEIGMMICKLTEPKSQRVMLLYLLEKKSWNEIAIKMKYSVMQIFRFRYAGYAELESILKRETHPGSFLT